MLKLLSADEILEIIVDYYGEEGEVGELDRALVRAAQKDTVRQLEQWARQPCNHYADYHRGYCHKCWQELKQEVENGTNKAI